MSSEIIVFLPGTTGSTLVRSGWTPAVLLPPVWPDGVLALAAAADPKGALRLLEGQLYPGVVPRFVPKMTFPPSLVPSVYGTLFNGLSRQFPYVCAVSPQVSDPPAPPAYWGLPTTIAGNMLIGFPYDWRQDNAITAKWLRSLLGTIYAATNESCTITLLAHSMGGLVARAYLEGPASRDPWFGSIKQLITIATPHIGAPAALGAISDNFDGLRPPAVPLPSFMDVVVWQFVNSSFDSTFELLPPPGNAFVNDGGTVKSIFPYSGLSQGLQSFLASKDFSTTDAQDAEDFLKKLSYKGAIPYFLIYGTGSPTAVGYTFANGALNVNNGDGDTIVPTPSASFAGTNVAATVAVPGSTHVLLPGNATVIAQIRKWMGLSASAADAA